MSTVDVCDWEDVVVVRSVRGKTLAVMAAHGSKPFMLPLYAEQRART